MGGIIERFQITGLHGYKPFDLRLDDNTIILVGENGSGKTTVLRLLFYLLSRQGNLLAQYKFKDLTITIDGQPCTLPYDWLKSTISQTGMHRFMALPPRIRREIDMIRGGPVDLIAPGLDTLAAREGISRHYIDGLLEGLQDDVFHREALHSDKHEKDLDDLFNTIERAIDAQILYLPTYRRIEPELTLVLNDTDDALLPIRHHTIHKNSRIFVELIEFGMSDVQAMVYESCKTLKDFYYDNVNTLTLSYLGDILDQRYTQVNIAEIKGISEDAIKRVLDRIPQDILSHSQKIHICDVIAEVRAKGRPDDHAKVICHYFLKLHHIQDELRHKEYPMRRFCEICNEYMSSNKHFDYDSASFTLTIRTKDYPSGDGNIEFRHLSSGEKQIASLFSHLYLSGGRRYFVLIDEPELSLSVPWQRRFLTDIKNGGFCAGLVAVTHSPFIYENELKKYAHGIGEFTA
ncbi:MAG: AAA family ATPase [Syntrophobacteraceae bacterium]|jgi:predicted ATPase